MGLESEGLMQLISCPTLGFSCLLCLYAVMVYAAEKETFVVQLILAG